MVTSVESQPKNRYARVRDDHALETAEDYLELVEELRATTGEARAVDIAASMQVTHATASKVLARLEREGYLTSRPYRGVTPTERGAELARRSRERHDLVYRFLLALGVPDEDALTDAEGIEHHVGEQTLESMRRFLSRQTP